MVGDFMESNGYNLKTIITPRDMKERFVPPGYKGIVHEGEFIATAEYKWRG